MSLPMEQAAEHVVPSARSTDADMSDKMLVKPVWHRVWGDGAVAVQAIDKNQSGIKRYRTAAKATLFFGYTEMAQFC